ncbi:oligosaccharyl transferase subunit OST3/OST6 family [Cylindrobasidium torrendii FP15055 ss-10]|uniref:Oligosaccharyl transferase subunit OST3/OST6 family n=1 Tax=Cylindrobasidium torrendii FP15055 ss-10 TaxID=1314674 RepID=A0A0D7BLB1_9AGAR|nr:oligosaccharyl transferase subunit OST3/OST6 family [Cylindrobasidium torrendii FP15055 ss-10]
MHWLPALLLPLLVLAKDPQLELAELAEKGNGVIKLTPNTFELLTSSNRNWSAAIQLTALDKRRRCEPCKNFDPSWNEVAQAWHKVPKAERDNHFFATLDFDDGQATFQKLGLSSAPAVYIYSATDGPHAPASGRFGPHKYDFSSGFEAGPLAEQLSRHTPIPIPYSEPFNWGKLLTSIAGVVSFLSLLRWVGPFLQNKWVWAAGTIFTSLVMTSGYMFTQIRGVPFTGPNGSWVAAGYQNMYGQEVQVISLIYGTLALSFLMLTAVVPYQTSPGRQRVQVYLWTFVIMLVYSVLIALFKVKNRGYPFRLFL